MECGDESDVNALITGNIGTGSGVVNVNATSVPETYSRAFGVSVAAGASRASKKIPRNTLRKLTRK